MKLLPSLALLALLVAAPFAQASGPRPASQAVPFAFEEELEFEAEEDEASEAELAEEECAEGREEAAAGEIDQEELEEDCEKPTKERGRNASSANCPLHSASAHEATSHDQLKVTLGYTTNEPFQATIEIHKGSTHQAFNRHLGRSGVLRFVLDDKQGTGQTVLRIGVPSTEGAGCPSRRLVLTAR